MRSTDFFIEKAKEYSNSIDEILPDLQQAFPRLAKGRDKRKPHLTKGDPLELRQQTVPQCFCGNAGSVGNEENCSGVPVDHRKSPTVKSG